MNITKHLKTSILNERHNFIKGNKTHHVLLAIRFIRGSLTTLAGALCVAMHTVRARAAGQRGRNGGGGR